ncbi:hypothetical protein McanMca71_008011 [Microsporum canis]
MNMVQGGPPVQSKDAVIGRKLRELGETLCFFGLNDMGAYLKEISNSPKSVTLFFDMITSKIKREIQPPIPPSRAEIFATFKKDEEMLSKEQVAKLVNLTSSWDTDDESLEDLKTLAQTWLSTPATFFDTDKPSLAGNDGLIEFCFDNANHVKDTGSTRRKIDNILLDNALKHKEEYLREKYVNGESGGQRRYKTNRSKAIDEFTYRYFGDLSEKDRKTKYQKMKTQRISGSKWDQIKPRWMILALKDAKTTCFETKKLEPIEVSALNSYIPHLKAHKYGSILKPAYSRILSEYKRRSQHEDGGESHEGDYGLEWIDSLLDSDDMPSNPLSGVEGVLSPLSGVEDSNLSAGLLTPCTSPQGDSYAESVESTPANSPLLTRYPDNPSGWRGIEQSDQIVVESRHSPHLVTDDGSRPNQLNRNIMERGSEIDSSRFLNHDARDADAANTLSQLHSTCVISEALPCTARVSIEPVVSPYEQGVGMGFTPYGIHKKRLCPDNELQDSCIHPSRRSRDGALNLFDAIGNLPTAVRSMGESYAFNPSYTNSTQNTSASLSTIEPTTVLIPNGTNNFTITLDALQGRAHLSNGEQDARIQAALNAERIVDYTVMNPMLSCHDPSFAATPSPVPMVMNQVIYGTYGPPSPPNLQVMNELLRPYEQLMTFPDVTS